jgi:hypothetical protein
MVIIALESAGRRLGMMVMGTESNQEFTQHELRSYQVVSEFVAIKS